MILPVKTGCPADVTERANVTAQINVKAEACKLILCHVQKTENASHETKQLTLSYKANKVHTRVDKNPRGLLHSAARISPKESTCVSLHFQAQMSKHGVPQAICHVSTFDKCVLTCCTVRFASEGLRCPGFLHCWWCVCPGALRGREGATDTPTLTAL